MTHSEDVVLTDDNGVEERIALGTKLKYNHAWALVKEGTPVISFVEETEVKVSAAGLVFPTAINKQQTQVLSRDIAVIVLREDTPGVFECLHKGNRIYVRYNDLIITSQASEMATLKDKQNILQ